MTNILFAVAKRALTPSGKSKARTLVKFFFFYLMSAKPLKSQDFISPHTSRSTLQFKIELRAQGDARPRHSRLFLLDRARRYSHQLWKTLLLAGFSKERRHLRCQEQHDPNGFHLGGNITLFVYTRAEQWVIASEALIRLGATRNS